MTYRVGVVFTYPPINKIRFAHVNHPLNLYRAVFQMITNVLLGAAVFLVATQLLSHHPYD